MSSQTQPGGTYGSNLAEQVSVDAMEPGVGEAPVSKPVGRPPRSNFHSMDSYGQSSVAAISMRLNQEASMLRIIAARVIGNKQRIAEVREALFQKSWELDRLAGSLQELP